MIMMAVMVNPTITTALVMDMSQVNIARVQVCTADTKPPPTNWMYDLRPSPRPMLASNRTGRNANMLMAIPHPQPLHLPILDR
jgi:hypothetical protein